MDKQKIREVIQIAAPAVLESLVSVVIAAIDTKMIAVLGKPAISAVSFTTQPKLIFFSIFFALGTAVSIFVSQAYGRMDKAEANAYLLSILRLAVVISLMMGAALYFLAGPVMKLCNRQEDTLEMSVTFFRILMVFSTFQAVSVVLNAALRGIGKTKVSLISNIAMGVVDILFNYLLIEGRFGFPRLGVAGDAIATGLGTVAACGVSLAAVMIQTDFLSLRGFFSPRRAGSPEMHCSIREKAGNIIMENLFTRIGFLLSSIILSNLDSSRTAVYHVGMILLNYSFAFGDGIQSAAVALTGRSMGAKRFPALKEYFRICMITGIVCSLCLSILYTAGSTLFFGLYFSEDADIRDGFITSCIAALLTFLQILRIICVGGMRGMGEVKDPRHIATLCVFILNPALSLLFTAFFDFGIWGIWIASIITQTTWFVMGTVKCRKHLAMLPQPMGC